MKANKMILFIFLSVLCLGCASTDQVESEHFIFIKNETGEDISVTFKRADTELYTKKFSIKMGEKIKTFWSSGLEGEFLMDYDSAFVSYKEKILSDTLKTNTNSLLNLSSYTQSVISANKKMTSYEYLFILDGDYIDEYLKE